MKLSKPGCAARVSLPTRPLNLNTASETTMSGGGIGTLPLLASNPSVE